MWRWLGAAAIALAGFVLFEAPIAIAAVRLGLFWGTLAVAVAGLIVSYAILTIVPDIAQTSLSGRLRQRIREWAEKEAIRHGTRFRAITLTGLFVSSIILGPVITSVGVHIFGYRREAWTTAVVSSLIFALVWISFYSGLWAVARR